MHFNTLPFLCFHFFIEKKKKQTSDSSDSDDVVPLSSYLMPDKPAPESNSGEKPIKAAYLKNYVKKKQMLV